MKGISLVLKLGKKHKNSPYLQKENFLYLKNQ